jgi:NAD(P)-dependent dehydrogenase (short-subunit alcohol dehydrogenase family)
MLLNDKVAVVTGSGTGIGEAFAKALAAAGAKVVVNSRTASDVAAVVEQINKAGGTAEGCVASVSTMEGAGRIIQTAIDRFGRIDILINNAGIISPQKPVTSITEAEFDDVIAVNLKGTFACTKLAVPYMKEQKWGRIISMTSGAVQGIPFTTSYAGSKAGIIAMTLAWALELREYGITCNTIRASAYTRMLKRASEERRQMAIDRGEKVQTEMGGIPPQMAAPLAVFLSSEQASRITGQSIGIDGPKITVYSNIHPVSTAIMPGGWTVDLLMEHFNSALGTRLEQFGWGGV